MKPPAFDYHRPTALKEALELLQEHGDEAKVLAGGQSLIPMMNMRLAIPGVLVDINGVEGISAIEHENGTVTIGALARHRAVERSQEIERTVPVLVEAAKHISHVTIRNRGTIGGSLAHSDPSAEWATVGLALGMGVTASSATGDRRISLPDLLIGPFYTSLEPTEMITSIDIPTSPQRTGAAFLELQRNHGNFAVVSACSVLSLAEDGTISSAALTLGGVAGTPVVLDELAGTLVGAEPTASVFEEIASGVAQQIDPSTDVQATAKYRRQTAVVLVRRALTTAAARAKGETTT
jgi:aerobic carbon-monoxide dehydrogenase medium subunit